MYMQAKKNSFYKQFPELFIVSRLGLEEMNNTNFFYVYIHY